MSKKIIFRKLTVKESEKILGGATELYLYCRQEPTLEDCIPPDNTCDYPVGPECEHLKPEYACTVNVETDCK